MECSGEPLGSWNVLNLQYRHIPGLTIFGEAQLRSLRFYNHFHYYEYKGGVTWNMMPGFSLTLGAGNYDTYSEGGNFVNPKSNDEFRLWPQAVLSQKLGRFKIEQRYRTEMRFTLFGYRNRFRYRLGITYPLWQKNETEIIKLGVSNELFFTNREPYFERNRLMAALSIKLSKNMDFQTGYIYQFDYRIKDETGRDFLVMGLYFDIPQFREMQKLNEADFRDN
jgi:hypothetical protein